jgi:hypothetical protein
MPVMTFLAAAHLLFWGSGVALALQEDTLSTLGAILVGLWLAAIGLWLVCVARMSRSGWLTGPGVAAMPWLWVPSPPVILSIAGLVMVPDLREAWIAVLAALPAIALSALNALRILAMGTVIKARRGQFPRRIGLGVGIPDTLFGLWSAHIALNGGFQSESQGLIWNVAGLLILLLMIPMVFTVLREPRLNAPGKGAARAILAFPMVLAPAGLATLFAVLHFLSLYRMLGPS